MSEQKSIGSIVETAAARKTFLQKLLDGVERVGNKVPHPAVIFFILSALVILLSHLFHLLGTSVTYEVVNPKTHKVEDATASVNSLLSGDGIRFMLTSMVRNFMNFGPVGIGSQREFHCPSPRTECSRRDVGRLFIGRLVRCHRHRCDTIQHRLDLVSLRTNVVVI